MKTGDTIIVRYVSPRKQTHVAFVKVTKIGRKYLHCVTLFVDNEGKIREGHPRKFDMKNEKTAFYMGIRHDLRNTMDNYRKDIVQWHQRRNSQYKEYDWIARRLREEWMDAWRTENPYPQLPIFPEGTQNEFKG